MERAFAAAVAGAAELVVRAWYEGWFGFIMLERAFAAAVAGAVELDTRAWYEGWFGFI